MNTAKTLPTQKGQETRVVQPGRPPSAVAHPLAEMSTPTEIAPRRGPSLSPYFPFLLTVEVAVSRNDCYALVLCARLTRPPFSLPSRSGHA